MSKIEIKAFIDTENVEEMEAAIAFMQMLEPNSGVVATPKTTKKSRKKDTSAVDEKVIPAAKELVGNTVPSATEGEPEIKIGDIIEICKPLTAPTNHSSEENRNAIKAKLEVFNAINFPSLDKKHFAEMKTWLEEKFKS